MSYKYSNPFKRVPTDNFRTVQSQFKAYHLTIENCYMKPALLLNVTVNDMTESSAVVSWTWPLFTHDLGLFSHNMYIADTSLIHDRCSGVNFNNKSYVILLNPLSISFARASSSHRRNGNGSDANISCCIMGTTSRNRWEWNSRRIRGLCRASELFV